MQKNGKKKHQTMMEICLYILAEAVSIKSLRKKTSKGQLRVHEPRSKITSFKGTLEKDRVFFQNSISIKQVQNMVNYNK